MPLLYILPYYGYHLLLLLYYVYYITYERAIITPHIIRVLYICAADTLLSMRHAGESTWRDIIFFSRAPYMVVTFMLLCIDMLYAIEELIYIAYYIRHFHAMLMHIIFTAITPWYCYYYYEFICAPHCLYDIRLRLRAFY
jgi:hypothetical protein